MTLHKEYHTLENGKVIKFSVSFNRERTNWATSQPIDIGYRVSVVPVEITKRDNVTIESVGAFTGFNATLLAIDRQSSKRLQTAIGELNLRRERYLDWFRVKFELMTSEQFKMKHEPLFVAA